MNIQNELIKDFVDCLGLSNWNLIDNCDIYITIEDLNGKQLQIWQVFEDIIVYSNNVKLGTYSKKELINKYGNKEKMWILNS